MHGNTCRTRRSRLPRSIRCASSGGRQASSAVQWPVRVCASDNPDIFSAEWSVLAGLVLVCGQAHFPIAVATGVKCTPYEQLSSFGDVLHDCHAEVLTRRAARTWLLDRLVKEAASDSQTIDGIPRVFIRRDTPDGPRWTLAEQASLHWYVSAPPCGEASSYVLQTKFHNDYSPNGEAVRENGGVSLLRGRDATCAARSGVVVRTKPGTSQWCDGACLLNC